MRTLTLRSDQTVPVLGQGTWTMGESRARRDEEIAALRCGLDLGMTLIDTAEMYGDGETERLVGEAGAGRREEVFLVSKVYPHNATRKGTLAACERSLKRLGTDRIDLYLLHWRGSVPLAETMEAFARLVAAGKIRAYGVSNFDVADMAELWDTSGGEAAAANQVLYNLNGRGVEWELLPWCQRRRVALMAYSPFEQGRMLDRPALHRVAERHGVSPPQVALAWLLHQDGVVVIPKAGRLKHVEENRAALDLVLTDEDLTDLNAAFPPPAGPRPLVVI